jgi:hypothetical protein
VRARLTSLAAPNTGPILGKQTSGPITGHLGDSRSEHCWRTGGDDHGRRAEKRQARQGDHEEPLRDRAIAPCLRKPTSAM